MSKGTSNGQGEARWARAGSRARAWDACVVSPSLRELLLPLLAAATSRCRDVRGAVDLCHRDGSIKREVAAHPEKYIHDDPGLVPLLQVGRGARRVLGGRRRRGGWVHAGARAVEWVVQRRSGWWQAVLALASWRRAKVVARCCRCMHASTHPPSDPSLPSIIFVRTRA